MFQIIWYRIYINTEKQAYRKYTGHKKLAWVNISYCTILAGVGKGIVAIRSEWIQGGERERASKREREKGNNTGAVFVGCLGIPGSPAGMGIISKKHPANN